MKTKLIFALAVLLSSAFNASAVEFKMAEVTYAPPKIAVYNDGHNTYIQSIPGLVIKGATADGDRLIISGVPREIQGWIGSKPITINQYASTKSAPSAPVAVPTQAGESLKARLAKLEKELDKKEEQYRAQTATAAPEEKAKPAAPAKPVQPEQVWEIRKSDGTLFGALSRWTNAANPKRQLIYATDGNDFAADPEASFTGDFDSAIAQLMESLQHSSYPLRACGWDNKPYPVLKIVHKNKRCED